MTTLRSYDLNGKKLSFANWISNLSPQDVPFTSMTGKESINQTLFQWQTDSLSKAGDNAQVEGTDAKEGFMKTTSVKSNITQILRKTVKVSDTANALANYGRGKELQYQMEKAGKEIKRDLELAFLSNEGAVQETATEGRQTAGFLGLVAPLGTPCPETGAVVHKVTETGELTEKDLFDLTFNLYLSGSKADIIMYHPSHASFFSSLQEHTEAGGNRMRVFKDTPKAAFNVSTLVDPLGQEYKLLPNRWMVPGRVYFFNSSDWTQMVLRTPTRTKLAKDGSYEKWMIEMEVGLRHKHPYASGVLIIQAADAFFPHDVDAAVSATLINNADKVVKIGIKLNETCDVAQPFNDKTNNFNIGTDGFGDLVLEIKTGAASAQTIRVMKDGVEVVRSYSGGAQTFDTANPLLIKKAPLTVSDAGQYSVEVTGLKAGDTKLSTYITHGMNLSIIRHAEGPNDGGAGAGPIRKAKAKKEAKPQEAVVVEAAVVEPVVAEAPAKKAKAKAAKK